MYLNKLYSESYSYLAADARSADKVKPHIEEALISYSGLIPDSLFENLIESIPRALQ